MKFEINIYDEFYKLMEQIPEGRVTTYGDIAIALGDISAARAVGQMLSNNKDPSKYPCHRVISSDGSMGGFTHPDGIKEKIRRLAKEGIKISNGKVENFESIRFKEFKSDYPLKRFTEWALSLNIDENNDRPQCINAMDISYSGNIGIGVSVSFDPDLSFRVLMKKVKSPYIPNYLYLREGEIYEALVDRDCLNVIDGNGILHKFGRGVATIVGIVTGSSTLGIAKSLLTGNVISDKVYIDGQEAGRIFKKYILSKGNKIDFDFVYNIITHDKFFPQTKIADKLSRRYRDEILPAEYSL